MHSHLSQVIRRGWKIFPLIHKSRFAVSQPLLEHATDSVEQVELWQTEYPDCGWAVATGERSGIFALEISFDLGFRKIRSLCPGQAELSAVSLFAPHSCQRVSTTKCGLGAAPNVTAITDKVHRGQHEMPALSMRSALPNATFLIFTATPQFGGDEHTEEAFGHSASIFNCRYPAELFDQKGSAISEHSCERNLRHDLNLCE